MLVFPCTYSIGLEGVISSVIRVILKSKDKTIRLNLSNCEPTVTVISHTFYEISFCVNRVLDIGVMQPPKLPINIQNEVCSKMDREVYAYAHRII